MKTTPQELDKLYRFEFKYKLPLYLRSFIEDEFVKMNSREDENTRSDGFYYISSLYFDTYDFSDYFDKTGGFNERKKIRARIYADSMNHETDKIWLELKHKHDMRIFKERVVLTKEEWQDFPRINKENNKILKKILYYILSEQRKPYLFVRYKRKAYIFDQAGFDVRFTFDYDIEACQSNTLECNKKSFIRVAPNHFVLEVKFDKFIPKWFDLVIKKYNLNRVPFSKYAYALGAVRRFNPISR